MLRRSGALILLVLLSISGSAWAETIKVSIGQATSTLAFLPLYAARALDTFAAAGVELKFVQTPGGDPIALAALDAGDIDFAAVGGETAITAIGKGVPFQIVYALMSKLSADLTVSGAFMTRAGVGPGDPLARRLAALKGATIGVSAVKGTQERVARLLVQQAGLDPLRDIKIASIGAPPSLQAALANGTIDGFVLTAPEGLLAEANGGGKILIRLGGEIDGFRSLLYQALVMRAPVDAAHAEAATRVAHALVAASTAIEKDPDAVAGRIQQAYFPKTAPELMTAAVRELKDGVAEHGAVSAASIGRLIDFTQATAGKLDKPLDAAGGDGQFWTNRFVQAATQ
ncbi:MAG TPA: ABC transporter substrate-binding protein [Stellaceae bacterium]|nr:ABC transporter substrate-binding protein [Stellaceae bacterium]